MWLKCFRVRARAEAQSALHHLDHFELPPKSPALGFDADGGGRLPPGL